MSSVPVPVSSPRRAGTPLLALVVTLALGGCDGGAGASRDQVRAVGSSTVYPFAKAEIGRAHV